MKQEDIEKTINVCLVIPMGLPGSGKTYYVNKHYKNPGKDYIYINFDEYMEKSKSISVILHSEFKRYASYAGWDPNSDIDIYLDGLWLKTDQVDELIHKSIGQINEWFYDKNSFYGDHYNYKNILTFAVKSIKIIHFDENRELCLNNDRFRREHSSGITIKKAPFDNVITTDFLNSLKEKYNINDIELINMEIHKSTLWETYFEGKSLRTEKWTLAGEWGTYWGGHGELEEEAPLPFTEFEDFVLKICPDISHTHYTALFNEACHIKEESETGYYGSWEDYAYWECDLKKLYNMMLEKKLISEYL